MMLMDLYRASRRGEDPWYTGDIEAARDVSQGCQGLFAYITSKKKR